MRTFSLLWISLECMLSRLHLKANRPDVLRQSLIGIWIEERVNAGYPAPLRPNTSPTVVPPFTGAWNRTRGYLRPRRWPSGYVSVSSGKQPINVDLSTGQPGRGDLQVASWVDDISQERYDWRYQLTLSGGGLVERKGRFDFEAPDEGYQPDVEVNMPAAAAKWSIGAERDYFAKLADGRYARFVVRFYPRRRNFVVIESHVNPIPGNRNLEFAPNTRVQPSRSD